VDGEALIGESRWPPALAVLLLLAIDLTVRVSEPDERVVHAPWIMPAILAVLLLVLLTSNPNGPVERRALHRTGLLLVGLLVVVALWATARLIDELIDGSGVSQDPAELLASGALVWLGNNLAFALLYWLLDGGGPIARLRRAIPLDFAFTQQLEPAVAPPGWRPRFPDYLHLGFTNATAFSPTDVMPLTHRAKAAMVVQSTIALALFGLVVARAVNAFQ
jgi:hypothetical protein